MKRRKATKPKEKKVGWKQVFLKALALSGSPSKAAKDAQINRQWAYRAREADKEFDDAWKDAVENEHVELLEAEAARRAFAGSDTMLIFVLKARRPDVYRDRHEVEYKGSLGIEIGEIVASNRQEAKGLLPALSKAGRVSGRNGTL